MVSLTCPREKRARLDDFTMWYFQVGKARHILSLGDKLMSSDRPDSTLIADSGVISDGSTYSSRGSLGSISLSSSFLSLASLPAGKSPLSTTNADPEKARQNLLNVVRHLF